MRWVHRLIVAASVFAAATAAVAGDRQPKPTVRFAKSWAAAVAEGKELNLPIVVHNWISGTPDCWLFHEQVLQNAKYIQFADENTVEVIVFVLDRDGRGGPRTDDYEGKDGKRYMVEFPNLTRAELKDLGDSRGDFFMEGGHRRYPVIQFVDPHTEQEMQRVEGVKSAKDMTQAVEFHRKALEKQNGPATSRAHLRKCDEESRRILADLPKAGPAKSFADLRKLEKSLEKGTEKVKEKLGELRAKLLDAAREELDRVEGLVKAGDLEGARKALEKLGTALEGTPLAARVTDLASRSKESKPAK